MSAETACGDLRVLELAGSPAGSLAGMLLADNGAQVLVVEPPGGSPMREGPGFLMFNRGKESLLADLKSDAGRAQVLDLVRHADVVLTSWRPGVAERLGVDDSVLRRANPRLVHAAITGFGPIAKLAEVQGYEHLVSAALGKMSELDDISGKAAHRPEEVPTFTAAPANTYGAASLAFQGILAALLERDRTGLGQFLETSLFDGAFATHLMRKDMSRGASKASRERGEWFALRHRGVRLAFLTAECADGRFIQMCARQDHHFRNWLSVIGLADVLEEPRYADVPLGFKSIVDADELEGLVRARMKERTQAEWMRVFIEDVDVGADPFLTFTEFLEHPQMVENDRVVTVADPRLGPLTEVGPIALAHGTPARIERSAPALDEHGALDWALGPNEPAPANASPARAGEGPLAGVTVLELATYVAGPWAGTLLAELGARVIKVEPITGDTYRRSGTFVHLAHGKESVALNLKHPESTAILHELIRRCDVLLENFRPGVPERLGFGYETVAELAPHVVYVYAASYGSRGPQSHRAAFHSTPNALCGGGILQAGVGNAPVDDSFPDPCSAVGAATAMLIGLAARRRTGKGQYLETSMLASAGYVYAEELVEYPDRPPRHRVDGDQMGYDACYRLYPVADSWIFLGVTSDAEWARLAPALGRSELLGDPRFSDRAARLADDHELAESLGEVLLDGSAASWVERLRAADIAVVAVDPARGFAGVLIEEGLADEGEHPAFGAYWKNRPLYRFSRSTAVVGPPCALGEHTAAVLAELGYDEARIAELVTAGAVALVDNTEAR